MKQLHLYVSGFVQGVGYRRYVQRNARNLGLTGWVTNLTDRRVEAVLQGSEASLEQMISICEKGPFLSEVKHLSYVWEDPTDHFQKFTIIK